MGKRVRLTDDSLNSYGSRVLTGGVDVKQYERNPVLLYMHERGKVIGYMKDIEVKDGEITAEPVFDEATELSCQCKKQWEVGSLRMVSIGIDILETSEDAEHLVPGQTSATITRSRIFEVSVVDIGANDNAIVLRRDGKQITLGKDTENPLPLLNNLNNKPNFPMELKTIARQLGMPETADESAVLARIDTLRKQEEENRTLLAEKEQTQQRLISEAVDKAIGERRFSSARRQHFLDLGKKVGLELLKTTLEAMAPVAKLTDTIVPEKQEFHGTSGNYKTLHEVPEAELRKMRADNPDEYSRLFKAEYGYEPKFL